MAPHARAAAAWGATILLLLGGHAARAHSFTAAQCRDLLKNLISGSADRDVIAMYGAHRTSLRRVQNELNAVLRPLYKPENEGHTGQQRFQQAWYSAVAALPCVRTVCEIGLNAGHSATVWLTSKPNLRLYSFDMGAQTYTQRTVKFLSEKFPDRTTFTFGNSLETVPKFLESKLKGQCDIVVVDGGHQEETAWQDMLNMRALANPDFSVFIIDDVNCGSPHCKGVNAAVARGVREGVIEILLNRSATWEGDLLTDQAAATRGFALGSYVKQTQPLQEEGTHT